MRRLPPRHRSRQSRNRAHPRWRNPFPKMETPLDEAAKLVEVVKENSKTASVYTPVLDPALAEAAGYPPEMFTPLNIAAASLKPKLSQQLLDLFLSDPLERQGKTGFYRHVVDIIEGVEDAPTPTRKYGTYKYETGSIPDDWRVNKKEFGKEISNSSPLERAYFLFKDDFEGAPATYSEFESALSQRKRAAQRRLRRRHFR